MTDVRKASWTLRLPGELPVWTPNKRGHWSGRHEAQSQWRETVGWQAKAARIPACQRIHVRLHYWPNDRIRRDPDNLILAQKAAVDGLVDAGVVEDDTAAFVDWSRPRIHGPDDGGRRWELHISDVG